MIRNALLLRMFIVLSLAATFGAPTDTWQLHWVHINRGGPTNANHINLNTASQEELMQLPGIGEAEAKEIIAGRPYRSKRDLVGRKIVSREIYFSIRQRVTTSEPPQR